jgi:hypothetical protein
VVFAPSLRKLQLCNVRLSEPCTFKSLAPLKRLLHFGFSGVKQLDDCDQHFATLDGLAQCTSLRYLYMAFGNVETKKDLIIAGDEWKKLTRLANLQCLALRAQAITDDGIKSIGRGASNLTTLALRSCQDVVDLSCVSLPNLRMLKLHDCSGLVHVCELPNLENVVCDKCTNLSRDAVFSILRGHHVCKAQFPNIKGVDDRMCEELVKCTKLQNLNLGATSVSYQGKIWTHIPMPLVMSCSRCGNACASFLAKAKHAKAHRVR